MAWALDMVLILLMETGVRKMGLNLSGKIDGALKDMLVKGGLKDTHLEPPKPCQGTQAATPGIVVSGEISVGKRVLVGKHSDPVKHPCTVADDLGN